MREKLADELSEIPALIRDPIYHAKGVRRAAIVQGVGRLQQRLGTDAAEQLPDHAARDLPLRKRGELVQKAFGVPKRAAPLAGDDRQGLRLDHDVLGLRDLAQLRRERLDARPAEVEALAPADDGGQDLVLLRRR